jgi:guanylate kinase
MELSINDLKEELSKVSNDLDYVIIYFLGEEYIDLNLKINNRHKDKEANLRKYLNRKYKFLRTITIEYFDEEIKDY